MKNEQITTACINVNGSHKHNVEAKENMLNDSIDTHWKIAKISLGVRNTDVDYIYGGRDRKWLKGI